MREKLLLAVSGYKGSGKNLAASMIVEIVEACGGKATELAFADPLKEIVAKVFDWDDDILRGESSKRETPDKRYPLTEGSPYRPLFGLGPREPALISPRMALQTLGTEWGRNLCLDIWAQYGVRRAVARLYENHDDVVVITDCRFGNEVDSIKSAGGIVIRIDRPDVTPDDLSSLHGSEQEIGSLLVDEEINNSGTKADLFFHLIKLVTDYTNLRVLRNRINLIGDRAMFIRNDGYMCPIPMDASPDRATPQVAAKGEYLSSVPEIQSLTVDGSFSHEDERTLHVQVRSENEAPPFVLYADLDSILAEIYNRSNRDSLKALFMKQGWGPEDNDQSGPWITKVMAYSDIDAVIAEANKTTVPKFRLTLQRQETQS